MHPFQTDSPLLLLLSMELPKPVLLHLRHTSGKSEFMIGWFNYGFSNRLENAGFVVVHYFVKTASISIKICFFLFQKNSFLFFFIFQFRLRKLFQSLKRTIRHKHFEHGREALAVQISRFSFFFLSSFSSFLCFFQSFLSFFLSFFLSPIIHSFIHSFISFISFFLSPVFLSFFPLRSPPPFLSQAVDGIFSGNPQLGTALLHLHRELHAADPSRVWLKWDCDAQAPQLEDVVAMERGRVDEVGENEDNNI